VTSEDLAQEAYAAYATYLEWHMAQGREQPVWVDLPGAQRQAWRAAVARMTQLCGVVLDALPEEP
jgi:hypothetical protein